MSSMNLTPLEPYRVPKGGFDIFRVPKFAQEVLHVDPSTLQSTLESNYPIRHAGDAIAPGEVQWVEGDHAALKYRGNTLKRGKIWLQRGDPTAEGFRRYYYTGWQTAVLPATADVAKCPEVQTVWDKYDAWTDTLGAPRANHAIVTHYVDGAHSIGYHHDKERSIAAGSLIVIVKTGEEGRPFQARQRLFPPWSEEVPADMRERTPMAAVEKSKRVGWSAAKLARYQADQRRKASFTARQEAVAAFFDEVLQPGDALVMTLDANLATQHGVPEMTEAAPSGSIVFRTITETVPYAEAVAATTVMAPRRTGARLAAPILEAFTATFGDRAENHAGMQMIGQKAAKGVSVKQLRAIKAQLDAQGIPCTLFDLRALAPALALPKAAVLVVWGGINALLGSPQAEAAMLAELRAMPKDAQMFDRGKVKTRHSCHNNTMGDFDQAPDIANKKGTVVNFQDYPVTSQLRRVLTGLLDAPAPLMGELNHYFNADKCGIGWHGDGERMLVAGARLGPGADGMPLKYQWFQFRRPVGAEGRVMLNAGDVYIASAKTVGTDWKRRKVPTLRHAAGKDTCKYALGKRKAGEEAPRPVTFARPAL